MMDYMSEQCISIMSNRDKTHKDLIDMLNHMPRMNAFTVTLKDLIIMLRDVEAIQVKPDIVVYVDKIEEIIISGSNRILLNLKGKQYGLTVYSEEELRETFIYKDTIGAPI